jgi:hypothetical protein
MTATIEPPVTGEAGTSPGEEENWEGRAQIAERCIRRARDYLTAGRGAEYFRHDKLREWQKLLETGIEAAIREQAGTPAGEPVPDLSTLEPRARALAGEAAMATMRGDAIWGHQQNIFCEEGLTHFLRAVGLPAPTRLMEYRVTLSFNFTPGSDGEGRPLDYSLRAAPGRVGEELAAALRAELPAMLEQAARKDPHFRQVSDPRELAMKVSIHNNAWLCQ